MTPEKIIKIISITLSGFFFYFSYLVIESIYPISFKSFEDMYFLSIMIIFAIAIVLFYKRKKTGWFLLVVCFSYFAITAIDVLIYYAKLGFYGVNVFSVYNFLSSPITHMLTLVFFVGIIGVISRKNIRSVYSINGRTVIYTILIATIVGTLFFEYYT